MFGVDCIHIGNYQIILNTLHVIYRARVVLTGDRKEKKRARADWKQNEEQQQPHQSWTRLDITFIRMIVARNITFLVASSECTTRLTVRVINGSNGTRFLQIGVQIAASEKRTGSIHRNWWRSRLQQIRQLVGRYRRAMHIFTAIESSDYKARNFRLVVTSCFSENSTFAEVRLFVGDYTKDKNKRSDYGYA